MICDLCGGYYTTYQYMQAYSADYYDEFGHYNSYFDQCNSSWGNWLAFILPIFS